MIFKTDKSENRIFLQSDLICLFYAVPLKFSSINRTIFSLIFSFLFIITMSIDLIQSLTCFACNNILNDPITLSCGNTICSHCFPISSPTAIKKSVFQCPVSHCTSTSHLFGRELLADASISEIVNLVHQHGSCTNEFIQSIIPLFNCRACSSPVSDPVTTPCGHTFCRLCVLEAKIDSDTCTTCYRPLPKYSTLATQSSNHFISTIIKELENSGLIASGSCNRETTLLDSTHLQQYNVPLFVSNQVILPGQTVQLPVFQADQVRMFRNALVPSSRYNGLCLASVHRNKPAVAQFGTLLQITSVEHRSDAIIIEVVGVDRFQLDTHYEQDASTLHGDFAILHEEAIKLLSIELPTANTPDALLQQREHITQYAINLAETILQFIYHLGSESNMPANAIHTQTNGLMGPAWLDRMQSIHGPVPPKENPIAVCYWAAAILPSASSNNYYSLLRTIPIIDRLELVISWMQDLQSQWQKARSMALHAMNQIPL